MSVYSAQTNVTSDKSLFILNSGSAVAPAAQISSITGVSSINGYSYAPFLSGTSTMGAGVSTMIINVPLGPPASKGYGVQLTLAGGAPSAAAPTWATNGASSFFVNAPASSSFVWTMIGATQ